jgi:5-hydroxyisourate hydrolase-like protein (transthyretin family)
MGSSSGAEAAGRPRALRMLVALLGVLGLVALAPQLARAATVDGPITGQVTDSVGGAGIAGVTVNLYNQSSGGNEIAQTQTGTNGDYNLGSWPSGVTFAVEFDDVDAGYGPVWYSGEPDQTDATPITVTSTSGVTVNQALQPDAVTGQLTDQATGNALPGVEVELLSGPSTVLAQTTTDSNGNYSFGPIPPGVTYEVEFNPGGGDTGYNTAYYGGASPTAFSVTAGQTTSGINGQIQPDEVTGQLTEQATGGALSGIEVELLNGSGTEVAETTTDGNGDYSFSAIPPGTYHVEFNPQGANGSYNSANSGNFTVTAGQTTSGIDGQLFTGGLISGTVTNPAGQDISGASLQIVNVNTDYYYYATTGSNGTYTLDGLPTGSYHVLFRPPSGQDYLYQYYPDKSDAAAAQGVSVTTGQTTMNINASLATGATVSGQVTDASGNPVSGASVEVDDYGGNDPSYVYPSEVTTGSNGYWSIDGLPTGTYEVAFDPPSGSNYAFQYYDNVGGQDPPTPITLTAGSTTPDIDAALTIGGQISGTVTDGTTGKPAAGVYVEAVDDAGDTYSSATTDANGDYTLMGLSSSASYRVDFSPPQGSSLATEFYPSGATVQAATPVPVTVGQTTPNIDETLGAGGSISGKVTNAATGYPIGGVSVTLTDDAGNELYDDSGFSTEPDGTYDFTNLPPGSYKVEFDDATFFSKGGFAFQFYNDASTLGAASSVNVAAGQAVTGIDAALSEGGTLEGHVTDAVTGQGIADVDVEVVDRSDNFLIFAETDVNGFYEIPGIAPGSYYVEVFPDGGPPNYEPQFYGGTLSLSGATPVTIAAGATTAGIDIALPLASANSPSNPNPPVTTTTTTTPSTTSTPTTTPPPTPLGQVTRVTPGPPALSAGSVSGLGKGKPVVKFRLRSGSNGAPKLRSFKVRLPAGLAFVANQLRGGVKVTGGGKVTEKVTGGQLLVTLGSPASTLTVSISSPALQVTQQLSAEAARKKAGAVKVIVTVAPVNQTGRMLSFTVKNPS